MQNRLPLLIVLALVFGGCARMELSSANLENHVQINPSTQPVKKHFEESEWNHYFLFRLVPTAKPKISEMISSHVAPGESVVGLKVKKETSFVNGLICVLVGIIYCPDTLTIEGDVAMAPSGEDQK